MRAGDKGERLPAIIGFRPLSAAISHASQRVPARITVLASALLAAAPIAAQPQRAETDDGVKTLDITRADATPVVDGVLDEDVWSQATHVEDLHQLDPVEYAAPSEATDIRLFYTDDALYVAARLWDSRPDEITAQVLRQGAGLANEDRFAVILDPNLDRRSGYRFQVNPNGVRWEALYQDTTDLQSDWDGIWRAAATRDDEGWTAELAIPFKTISFDPSADTWGINFERTIQRNNETIGWVSRNRDMNPSIAGTASGFENLEQGLGIDVVPSASVSEQRVYGPAPDSRSSLEPSLDVFYNVTPSLSAALTLNTDFSATEVDDRQVNLTRFNLFFPEKRDFFLQDADIFRFGRIGGGGGGGPSGGGASEENGRPFFSRNIGLGPDGEPVDIDYGAKLSGRAGRWNIGALGIRQAAYDGVGPSDMFVGRLSANVLDESTAGVIMTSGDPHSDRSSSLVGTDFLYRNSELPGDRILQGEAWYQQSDTEGIDGDDRAFGFGVSVPSATGLNGEAEYKQIEQNFDPALGFVNQPGIRDYLAELGYRWRLGTSYLRTISTDVEVSRTERLDPEGLDSEAVEIGFNIDTASQDDLFVNLHRDRTVLIDDFSIYSAPDGSNQVVIPEGDYEYDHVFLGLRSGSQRRVAGFLGMGTGEYYDGERTMIRTNFEWRPSEHLRLRTSYDVQDISLPDGDFMVRLASVRAQFVFSSTLSWVNLVQYDNISESVGINSRLHWIPEAGREGYIVLNHGLADRDRNDSFHSTNADATIKFSYTWRF